jgi:hypothetical protein
MQFTRRSDHRHCNAVARTSPENRVHRVGPVEEVSQELVCDIQLPHYAWLRGHRPAWRGACAVLSAKGTLFGGGSSYSWILSTLVNAENERVAYLMPHAFGPT